MKLLSAENPVVYNKQIKSQWVADIFSYSPVQKIHQLLLKANTLSSQLCQQSTVRHLMATYIFYLLQATCIIRYAILNDIIQLIEWRTRGLYG